MQTVIIVKTGISVCWCSEHCCIKLNCSLDAGSNVLCYTWWL